MHEICWEFPFVLWPWRLPFRFLLINISNTAKHKGTSTIHICSLFSLKTTFTCEQGVRRPVLSFFVPRYHLSLGLRHTIYKESTINENEEIVLQWSLMLSQLCQSISMLWIHGYCLKIEWYILLLLKLWLSAKST